MKHKRHWKTGSLRFLLNVLAIAITSVFLSSCYQNISIPKDNPADSSDVKWLLLDSFWVAILFVVLAFAVTVLMHFMESRRWNRIWEWVENKLIYIFLIVWMAGFCVYIAGMYIPGSGEDTWTQLSSAAWMAVIHAFGMFVLDSDISAVHQEFANNFFFMTWFSVVHFMAALVSMVFVIKHFGYNIVAGVQLLIAAHISQKKDNLYIFWGMNKASSYLAKDIKEHAPETHRIIFVRTADDEDDTNDRTGFDRLFSFLSVKNRELKEFKDLGCLSTSAFSRLSKCDLPESGHDRENVRILNDMLNLHSLVKLIGKTDKDIHIMMLGDDEESNVRAATNLCHDKDLNDYANAPGKHHVIIHCHARYNSINRALEDSTYADNLKVHIEDSSHMAVETLKSNMEPLCLPVDYVKVEKDATVSSPFHSMVIGMGECGRDAVKFLYQYGAFAKPTDAISNSSELSEFHCTVFDKDMKTIAPYFKSCNRGADVSPCSSLINIKDWRHRINLYQSDTNGKLFYDFLEANISKQNCIFISINDDEASITLAVRLLKLAIRKGADLEHFRIFVKSYNDDLLHHQEEVARHYNESVVKSLGLKKNKYPIYIFGKMRELYTWRYIIDDSMRKESYRYSNSYDGIVESEKDLGTASRKQLKDTLGDKPFAYGNLNSVRRMDLQNMENAWHRFTKIRLIRKALGNDESELRYMAQEITSRERFPDNTYGVNPTWQQIMDVVAHTEHLRWNASHEMLGYVYNKDIKKSQRDILLQHNCLTKWKNLDPCTQGYDYQVVETSLRLYLAGGE